MCHFHGQLNYKRRKRVCQSLSGVLSVHKHIFDFLSKFSLSGPNLVLYFSISLTLNRKSQLYQNRRVTLLIVFVFYNIQIKYRFVSSLDNRHCDGLVCHFIVVQISKINQSFRIISVDLDLIREFFFCLKVRAVILVVVCAGVS